MLAHFSNREVWTSLNQSLEAALKLETPKTSARFYQGVHHALTEVVTGLARQFPFKKNIYYWKGIDPYLEPVALYMSREGFPVTALNASKIQDPESWLETLGKDTLVVMLPEDDPLLGQLHPIKHIEEKLNEKRVFSLKLSHHAFRYREWPQSLEKFQIETYAIEQSLSMVLLGERARIGDLVSEGLTWKGGEVEKVLNLRPAKVPAKERIEAFERNLPEGFKPFFNHSDRLFDRSVFYSENLDGQAVIESLAKIHAVDLLPPGEETRYETASLSRWGGLRTMDWLKAFGLTPEQIRGLVILDEDVIRPNLEQELSLVRDDLLKRQGY